MEDKCAGLLTLLGIAFIILKLCNIITWSWIWVLSPFWIPLAVVLIVLLIFGAVLGIAIWNNIR